MTSSSNDFTWDGVEVVVDSREDGRTYITPEGTYVSVTSVLSQIYGDLFPPEAAAHVEHARDRGIELHRTMALLCGASPGLTANLDTIDPEVKIRVDLIREWMEDMSWHPVHVEKAFVSTRFRFAGTPDQVGYFDPCCQTDLTRRSSLVVLDFKPLQAPLARLQIAAYALLVRESLELDYAPRRIKLGVGQDVVRLQEYEQHARDRDLWLSALNCYRYGQEEKLWD